MNKELIDGSLEQLKHFVSLIHHIEPEQVEAKFNDNFYGFDMTFLTVKYKLGQYYFLIESKQELIDQTVRKDGLNEYEVKISLINNLVRQLKAKYGV